MRLIIAEKPSVAQAIADVLGGGKKLNGFIDIPALDTKVTWCYGHLLEQEQPESYVPGGKVLAEHLPVIPTEFKLSVCEGKVDQIKAIRDLLKDAKEVVNAGDADREGQLLVDELFLYFGWHGKTSRMWLSSLDAESVKTALLKIKPNSEYKKLYDSALARQRADWLISLNCSIALSRNLRAMGVMGAWSIGRVQTPTLTLLVDRADSIKNFTKRNHYQVEAQLGEGITSQWVTPEDLLIDGLLLDRAPADAAILGSIGQLMRVQKFQSKPGTRAAPLPYTLGGLQTAASSRLGLSASDTLAAAQALYEAKITTYPRSDCAYLPLEMHANAPAVLQSLGAQSLVGVDAARKHSVWNTGKVEAHHGIVPTGVDPTSAKLDEKALNLFGLIRESYIRLFMVPESFDTREAEFLGGASGDLVFKAKSRTVLISGWTSFGEHDEGDEKVASDHSQLPTLTVGQALTCTSAEVIEKQTAAPKPYTDGTLIAAMKSVHKLIQDVHLKARLKETSGLGTEATRAPMIEILLVRGYIERQRKDLVPTARGHQLIKWLRSEAGTALLTTPGATALQEDSLADIASGRMQLDDFLAQVVGSARDLCRLILAGQFVDASTLNFNTCPACKSERCVTKTSKAGSKYHGCLDCHATFGDVDGKPGKQYEERKEGEQKPAAKGPNCPACKKSTFCNETKTGRPYFRCGGCKNAWWPDRDSPKKLGGQWSKP
jgi:DNA topoisomerase-3